MGQLKPGVRGTVGSRGPGGPWDGWNQGPPAAPKHMTLQNPSRQQKNKKNLKRKFSLDSKQHPQQDLNQNSKNDQRLDRRARARGFHKIGQGTLGIILEPIFKSFKKSQKPDFITKLFF